jgi:hypothetical protein
MVSMVSISSKEAVRLGDCMRVLVSSLYSSCKVVRLESAGFEPPDGGCEVTDVVDSSKKCLISLTR